MGRLNWHGVGRRRSKSRLTMESADHSVLGVWVKPGSISNWNVLGAGMVSLSEPRNCQNNVPFSDSSSASDRPSFDDGHVFDEHRVALSYLRSGLLDF